MRVSEFRDAVLVMGDINDKLGAKDLAGSLHKLAQLIEPYGEPTITQFVNKARPKPSRKRKASKGSRRKSRQVG